MHANADGLARNPYVRLVTPHLTRLRNPDRLVLVTAEYTIVVQVHVTGLEIDAGSVEKMLRAPLTLLAERIRETI